jgi:hypothetical protein
LVGPAAVVERFRIAGLGGEGLVEFDDGFGSQAKHQPHQSAVVPGPSIIGLQLDYLAKGLQRGHAPKVAGLDARDNSQRRLRARFWHPIPFMREGSRLAERSYLRKGE